MPSLPGRHVFIYTGYERKTRLDLPFFNLRKNYFDSKSNP